MKKATFSGGFRLSRTIVLAILTMITIFTSGCENALGVSDEVAQSVTESEATVVVIDSVSYRIESDHAVLVRCVNKNHVIPVTVEGKPVTIIGERAFAGFSELTSVTIPDGVTTIGNTAFIDCDRLTICGTPGSEAEKVAERVRIPFKAIQKNHE